MRAALWTVVLAFAIVLQVAADIPIQPDIDMKKLEGTWFSNALVLNQGEAHSNLGPVTKVTLGVEGILIIRKLIPGENGCREETLALTPTDQPGKFTTEKKSIVRLVETDYSNYYVHHVETDGAVVNALHLYTRDPEASDEVKEKFKTLATSMGFPEDKIIYLTKPDTCKDF